MALITGTISLTSNLQETPSGIPGGQPFITSNAPKWFVSNGTGADQGDTKFVKTLSLAATPTVLDLTNLTDCFGSAISFARIKSLLIVNNSTTSGQVVTMGYSTTTTNAFTSLFSNPGTVVVHPSTTNNSGFVIFVAPGVNAWAVSGSNKLLQLDPGANTISVSVEIVGASI